ncbi:MAG: arginyltransferase [Spirochaetia bacterium]|nr:arginyltransferase [Spirochaetia bacterium]
MNTELSILEDLLHAGNFEESCPYLPEKDSCMVFLHGESLGHGYRLMLDHGYRRYGRFLYRTDCPSCGECRVIRIPVNQFEKTRSQKRIWKKGNQIFEYKIDTPLKTPEKENLYQKYLCSQHSHNEEIGESYEFFFTESFLEKDTKELQLYADGRLCGIGIMDFLSDTLSSVYFFFDPDYAKFSPGTYSILLEIEIAKEQGMKFYYPGFYIKDAKTMSYKSNFRPCYILDIKKEEWVPFAEDVERNLRNV